MHIPALLYQSIREATRPDSFTTMQRLTVIALLGLALAVPFGRTVESLSGEKAEDHEWVGADNFGIEASVEDLDGEVDTEPGSDQDIEEDETQSNLIFICDPGTGGSCYFYYKRRHYKWNEARQQCRHFHATLATIDDIHEDKFLRDIIDREGGQVWIGLNDKRIEGIWEWDGGATSRYRNWDNNEPNGGTKENCVEMRDHRDGKWNDESCEKDRGYICEQKRSTDEYSES
ncbi:lithostathine-like [Ptychodera flava]|uniref:lithostathine-like n=1 Tax=Ptychodera flava TaxID=63121 RepID=UPI003969EF54